MTCIIFLICLKAIIENVQLCYCFKSGFFPGYPALLVYKHLLCLPSTDLGAVGLHHLTPMLAMCQHLSPFFYFPCHCYRRTVIINISLLDSMGSFYFPLVNISVTIFLNTLQALLQFFTLLLSFLPLEIPYSYLQFQILSFFQGFSWNVNIIINIFLTRNIGSDWSVNWT